MAPETLFLALQCVQCSTMQVKPQKKSGNKWVCVVCNQRQSVLRIYARGYRAVDIRRFVQEANLSRGRREGMPEPEEEWGLAASAEHQQDEFPREKKRTDWFEYLDDLGERGGCGNVEECTPDGGTDIEVITELPQERAKGKPRKTQLGVAGKRLNPSTHPTLPKRRQIGQESSPYSATTSAKAERSQWSKNLGTRFFGEKNGSGSFEQNRLELDDGAATEVVDDEVHPDFM